MFHGKRERKFILASASPRRRELLLTMGVKAEVMPSDVDETSILEEGAEALTRRLAVLKAEAMATRFPDALVLGADTVVVLEKEILGKPANESDAKRMLRRIQGKKHVVTGSFCLMCPGRNIRKVITTNTEVEMAPLEDELIERYVATGEPLDKAGSYAIQGIGAQFVVSIKGSYSNVVGLDVAAVSTCLRELEHLEIF